MKQKGSLFQTYEAVGRWEPTPLLTRLLGYAPERRKRYRFERPDGLVSEGWEYR